MDLPQGLVKVSKSLKQEIIRTPEQLQADEQRRLALITKQFKDANKLTEQAQNELVALREDHKQSQLVQESKSEGSSLNNNNNNNNYNNQSNVDNTDAILNVSNQIKDLSSALASSRGESNPKKTIELKNRLRELTNSLSSLQDEMN